MRDWTPDEIRSMAGRLRRARLSAGFSRATEAVRQHGWNYSRYMNYENGERAIPPKQAVLFAAAFGVTVDHIYFGKTDLLNSLERSEGVAFKAVRSIPLIALENISELKRIASGSEPMLAAAVPITDDTMLPERLLFIQIEDRSMSSAEESVSFEPGDQALIELDAIATPSDFVLALVPEERAAVFRLYREISREADGTITFDLVPLNPNFRTIRVHNRDGAQIIGVCRRIHRIFDVSQASLRSRLS